MSGARGQEGVGRVQVGGQGRRSLERVLSSPRETCQQDESTYNAWIDWRPQY